MTRPMARPEGEPLCQLMKVSVPAMIKPIPVQRPSRPSMKFIAFVTPTIQATVTSHVSQIGKTQTVFETGSVRWST